MFQEKNYRPEGSTGEINTLHQQRTFFGYLMQVERNANAPQVEGCERGRSDEDSGIG